MATNRIWTTFSLALALAACSTEEVPDRQPLLVISGPKTIVSFEVHRKGEDLLWRIEAPEGVPLDELVYGHIPAGFEQVVPEDGGAPRPFFFGESLQMVTTSPGRRFVHHGIVGSAGRLDILSSETSLLRPQGPSGLAQLVQLGGQERTR